ncbi:hypothetical protein PAECIP111891_05132 [Paenibacillus allorhizoplanae]|uniref:Probable membrane transporter protein n=1 Tax=Paenibacillus allorhizoplanae TaxID=2905648 RepID=A0ABN8GX96_9BACL|nr:sulfite exporter TauE/SafE family protein [Paenibacillus allorhizoplanae]CAH1221182.1 hypothetical protein PAECIP111891_05132 [Paenibacillus allorhizoplanae]
MSFALVLIGLIGGILTGLMSVGGGLILTFLLLLTPPLFGQEYSMHMIAGMVIVQTLFSSSSGLVTYWKNHLIDWYLLRYMGPPSLIGGTIGSVLSNQMSHELLTAIFAILALIATASMFLQRVKATSPPYQNKTWAVSLGLGIGLLGGMFGLGAGFLLLPVLMNVFKIESRTAVGTGLALGLLLVVGALIGKTFGSAGTGFPWIEGLILAIGAIPGGLIGSRLANRMKSRSLQSVMSVALILVSIKLWADLLHVYGLVPKF